MAKKSSQYICQECGSVSQKWQGKCPDCGAWNSIIEEAINDNTSFYASKVNKLNNNQIQFFDINQEIAEQTRINSYYQELNQVLGGGFVPGSAVLIGGDPGIGKSTLLLQITAKLSSHNHKVIYVSGEESASQITLRAKRLNINNSGLKLLTATNLDLILNKVKDEQLDFLIIDSIQTVFLEAIGSAPGTVSQVRACSHELIRLAKERNITLILVGHVTKEGQIAGPKVLEHMVDTVLYFEGESSYQYRLLRSVKNRFGSINEIGVFEMHGSGLIEVTNPSSLFIGERSQNISGSSIYAGIEGTRPIFAEIQALVAPTFMATPRRAVVGWDNNRLAMIIAVLATRFGLNLTDKELYLNVMSGLKISEPAMDLSAAAALISAATNQPIIENSVFIGEVGLSGEVRTVQHLETRVKESVKLGFKNIITPKFTKDNELRDTLTKQQIQLHEIKHIKQLKQIIFS
ncbi:DNA repair protein RadA [Rickettsiales endosymbiont of Stachyamoeba lipophora]|uniref:DNA repair protein RadA n=1 Tax=Rickettsiales endosymbiont of Stachyamoeba lipophora TaxID=2486578 RepID=UPI000F646DD4|nr:DNA repair protein RadA [Rickettsiales endosymbiont of Stachyamoeba lipophora]AZL15933.1 DNA repair protein RadA [Rickettsiales endosymbiont of Stachyamoeba lipophora]